MIENHLIGISALLALFFLIVIRIPIALAMIIVALAGLAVIAGPNLILFQLQDLAFAQFSIYDLSVLPLFILMGFLAAESQFSDDLFTGAEALTRGMKGGVAVSSIIACAGFGAVCGSSLATVTAMGQVSLPQLRRFNYAPSLAAGALAAGGTLGILIPPSIILIIYAIIVEANIATMFAAAVLPGLLAVALFIVTIMVQVHLKPELAPKAPPISPKERLAKSLRILPALGLFGLVFGGIFAGWYGPTSAAAIAVTLVALYGTCRRLLGFHGMTLAGFGRAMHSTAITTGMIFTILLAAELMKIFFSRSGLPIFVTDNILQSGMAPMVVLSVVIAIFLILGCVLDSMSMVLLLLPFFWPVMSDLDFGMSEDHLKAWFGIIALVVVELGLITPPVGMNVFVISRLSDTIGLRAAFAGVTPFLIAEVLRVILLVAFPIISLALI